MYSLHTSGIQTKLIIMTSTITKLLLLGVSTTVLEGAE